MREPPPSQRGLDLDRPVRRPALTILPVETPSGVMALLERTRADLQGVEDPREAALFVVRTEAIQYLAEKAKAGHELQNQAAELALRAKRRAGELLAERPKHPPGPAPEIGNSVLPISP